MTIKKSNYEFLLNIGSAHHKLTPSSEMLHDLLVTFKEELSTKDKQQLNDSFTSMKLFKDVISVNEKHKIFNVDNTNNYYGVGQVCGIVQKLYGIDSIGDLTVNDWQRMLSTIIVDGVFSADIGSKFQNVLRVLAKTLVAKTKDKRYLINRTTSYKAPDQLKDKKKPGNKQTTLGSIIKAHPHYQKWVDAFEAYKGDIRLKSTKSIDSALAQLLKFVIETSLITEPLIYFSQNREDFFAWMEENDHPTRVSVAKYAQKFSLWFVENNLRDDSEEYEEPVYVGFPLFSDKRFANISGKIATKSGKLPETPKFPMPTRYVMMCKDILTENDFAFPKSLDFEYFEVMGENGKYVRKWSPVNTILFLTMFELPLRKIQVTSLDSGEGDELTYDIESKSWVENYSEHAGYWKITNAIRKARGFLTPSTTTPNKVDLYINTNKTADISEAFSETSGYTIPWHNERVIELTDYLRKWQESNNPVSAPLSAMNLPKNTFSSVPTDGARQLMPDRFYLFRSQLNNTNSEAPIADFRTFKFWHHLMAELEKRLCAIGDDTKIVLSWSGKNPVPVSSIFTPHGLRVTGLTAFMEAGVPIDVLSKIVAGHASILMTLHYIKYNNTHITDVLSNAQLVIENTEQANYSEWLREAAWADAQKYSVFNDSVYFKANWEQQKYALFENRQIGMCPNAGTQCGSGGEVLRKNGENATHGPVEGGEGNCIMCRYFITGKPWAMPLWVKTNALLAESTQMAKRVDETRAKLEKLKKERFELVKQGGGQAVSADLKSRILHLESALENESKSLDQKLNESHRAYRIIEEVRSKMRGEGNTEHPLVPYSADENDQLVFDDVSSFKQLDFMVQASRAYPYINSDVFEKDRDHFIDTVLFNSGLNPISISPLTDAEKREAADAAAKYMVQTLTDMELEQLKDNSITLDELGYKSELKCVVNKEAAYKKNQIEVALIEG